jgi:hypothetical protein
MEAVARLMPAASEELLTIPEFRKWQVAELGEGFVTALEPFRGKRKPKDDSPYRD